MRVSQERLRQTATLVQQAVRRPPQECLHLLLLAEILAQLPINPPTTATVYVHMTLLHISCISWDPKLGATHHCVNVFIRDDRIFPLLPAPLPREVEAALVNFDLCFCGPVCLDKVCCAVVVEVTGRGEGERDVEGEDDLRGLLETWVDALELREEGPLDEDLVEDCPSPMLKKSTI